MKFSILLLLISITGWVQTAEARWSVATFNIRNFDNDRNAGPTDLKELGRIIKEVQSGVMAFEEVVNKSAFDSLVKKELKDYAYTISDCGGFGKQHLALAYNLTTFEYVSKMEDLTFSGSRTGCGSLRPLLLVSLKHKASNKVFTFGIAHLKAGGDNRAFSQRWAQYIKMEELSLKHAKENLILLGDMNTTGYNIKDEDFERFSEFLNASSMRTMTENLNCTNYWAGTLGGKEYQPSILDHIVVQEKNVNAIESVKVGAHCKAMDCRPATPQDLGKSYQSVSDHCPVQVVFK